MFDVGTQVIVKSPDHHAGTGGPVGRGHLAKLLVEGGDGAAGAVRLEEQLQPLDGGHGVKQGDLDHSLFHGRVSGQGLDGPGDWFGLVDGPEVVPGLRNLTIGQQQPPHLPGRVDVELFEVIPQGGGDVLQRGGADQRQPQLLPSTHQQGVEKSVPIVISTQLGDQSIEHFAGLPRGELLQGVEGGGIGGGRHGQDLATGDGNNADGRTS